jgi:hypothetical protein
VVSEAKRREDARKRYASLKQSYDAKQSIAQSVMQGLGSSMGAMMGGGAPGGLDAAMPPDMGGGMPPDMGGAPPDMGGAMPPDMGGLDAAMGGPPPGFARGGAIYRYAGGTGSTGVDTGAALQALFSGPGDTGGDTGAALQTMFGGAAPPAAPTSRQAAMGPLSFVYPEFNDPYASLRELYTKQMGEVDAEKERAGALALISAGLGIAGGKSQNFSRNLAGAQDAIKGYGENISGLEARRQALMGGQAQMAVNSQQELSKFKEGFQDTQEGRRQMAEQMGMDLSRPEVQAYIATGEGADLAFGVKSAVNYDDFMDGENTATGEAMKARLNPVTGQFEDPQGNQIAFRPFTADEIEYNKTRMRDLAKSLLTGNTYRKAVSTLDGVKRKTEGANSTMNDIQGLLQRGNVTGPFSLLANLQAGTPQYALARKVDKLKSNIATTVLQDLRAQSEDGSSGFGQLTKNEFDALQNSLGNLDVFQDAETFGQTVEDVRQQLNEIYRKAYISLMASLSEEGNAGLRNQEFESNMGMLLDLQAVDEQISGFGGAQPASSGSTDTGPMSTVTPPAPTVQSDSVGNFLQTLNPFQ